MPDLVEAPFEENPVTLERQQATPPLRIRLRIPRFHDDRLPDVRVEAAATSDTAHPATGLRRFALRYRESFKTAVDKFGRFRLYHKKPVTIPDADLPVASVLDKSLAPAAPESTPTPTPSSQAPKNPWFPLPNYSAFRFAQYFWNGGSQKSKQDRENLLTVLGDPLFKTEDVLEVADWDKVDRTMDAVADGTLDDPSLPFMGDGWKADDVKISIPVGRGGTTRAVDYTVPGFHHRSITNVLRDTFANDPAAESFHYEPFREYWQDPNNPNAEPERVYGESYTSEAFNNAHEDIQKKPRYDGDSTPRVLASLMFSSDATHLTSFGTARAWPLYMSFGNQSKYERGRPTANAQHHLAYFPSVSLVS